MNKILAYTLHRIGAALQSPKLDNEKPRSPFEEGEKNMSANKKKIRREMTLNGVKVWITADTEQEYADKLLQLAGAGQPTGAKH